MRLNYKIFGNEAVGIVIEMGLGACISEWLPFIKQLKEPCGVLVYERAGINKSEASSLKRTPENIAKELRELLSTVNSEEKLLFLAHSQGGLYTMQFCGMYPELVKGVILLDPLSPGDNEFKESLNEKEYKQSGVDKSANMKIMRSFAKLKLGGLMKLLLKKAPPFYYYSGFSKEETKDILSVCSKPVHMETALNEYFEAHEKDNLKLFTNSDAFPDVPLFLVTHSSELAIEESMKFGRNSHEFAAKVEDMWQKIMQEYLKYSKKAKLIRAEKSTHFIHLQQPELINELIHKLIE